MAESMSMNFRILILQTMKVLIVYMHKHNTCNNIVITSSVKIAIEKVCSINVHAVLLQPPIIGIYICS